MWQQIKSALAWSAIWGAFLAVMFLFLAYGASYDMPGHGAFEFISQCKGVCS